MAALHASEKCSQPARLLRFFIDARLALSCDLLFLKWLLDSGYKKIMPQA